MDWTYAIAFTLAFPVYGWAIVRFVDHLQTVALTLIGIIVGFLVCALIAYGAERAHWAITDGGFLR